jgi:ribA/ribD-fused uncharacterized protein
MIRFNSRMNPTLGNFHQSPDQVKLTIDGHNYCFSSVEAAFHALKQHPYQTAQITPFTQYTPNEARYHGKRVPLRHDWHDVRVPLMRILCTNKFRHNPELQRFLHNTGDEPLIHYAPWDAFWGDGADGTGQNMLGIILMDIRKELS